MKPRVSRAKIAATTEADIRRHMREDSQSDNDFAEFAPVISPQVLRKPLHVATLRNWEQSRVLALTASSPKRLRSICAISPGEKVASGSYQDLHAFSWSEDPQKQA
jgi:hypothetical protein